MSIRPDTVAPDTSSKHGNDALNAEIAHEGTLRYFVEHTELGVLNKDQMGVMALVSSCKRMGIQLSATSDFFYDGNDTRISIRALSSGEEGKGRIQAKECITAGAFPMSLLFGEQKTGIIDTIKGLLGRKNAEAPPQRPA